MPKNRTGAHQQNDYCNDQNELWCTCRNKQEITARVLFLTPATLKNTYTFSPKYQVDNATTAVQKFQNLVWIRLVIPTKILLRN
jgi:hypothetical protein